MLEMNIGQKPNDDILLSIIIATLNREKQLESVLLSIASNSTPPFLYEILVVDQAMSINARIICDRCGANYYSMQEKGLSKARNLALQHCKGKYIAFMDDDAIVSESYLANVFSFITSNPAVDGVCGRILTCEDKTISFSRHQGELARVVSLLNIDIVLSSAFIIKKNVRDKIGDFDEDFGVGATWGASEETDFLLRMLKNCLLVTYCPSIIVYHPKADFSTMKYNLIVKKAFTYGRGRGALLRKHPSLSFKFKFYHLFIPLAGMLFSLASIAPKNFIKYVCSFYGRISGYYNYKPTNRFSNKSY